MVVLTLVTINCQKHRTKTTNNNSSRLMEEAAKDIPAVTVERDPVDSGAAWWASACDFIFFLI